MKPLYDVLRGATWFCDDPSTTYPFHQHSELEFNLIVRGYGTCLVGNKKVHLNIGNLLFLFPNQYHHLIGQSHDFALYVAAMDAEPLQELWGEDLPEALHTYPTAGYLLGKVTSQQLQWLSTSIRRLDDHKAQAFAYNLKFLNLFYDAWQIMDHSSQITRVEHIHPSVAKAVNLLERGEQDAKVLETARACGLSRSQLTNLFQQQLGATYTQIRNRCRLQRYLYLMSDRGGRNILETALEAGFGSYPQFYRVFKTEIGMSPNEFLQRESPVNRIE